MEVKLIILTVADLGFPEYAKTREIIGTPHDLDQDGNSSPFTSGKGSWLGLKLCPQDFGPMYRLQYDDQPLYERLYVAMKPIECSDGELRIFVLGHTLDGLSLGSALAKPDDKWHADDKFMFCT
jgi:hypothetical protein